MKKKKKKFKRKFVTSRMRRRKRFTDYEMQIRMLRRYFIEVYDRRSGNFQYRLGEGSFLRSTAERHAVRFFLELDEPFRVRLVPEVVS